MTDVTSEDAPPRLVRALDTSIRYAHRARVFGRPYHPYFIATDLSAVAIIILAVCYSRAVPGMELLRFVAAFVVMQATYKLFLIAKRRLFGIASRSFLQDTMLIILPSYALASHAFGNSVRASLDFAGLALPLGLHFIRLGCLFGGCCYGVPTRRGVLYPREIFEPVASCRRFSPGEIPEGRVFPIQLAESAFNGLLFVLLAGWVWHDRSSSGRVLPAYLCSYAAWRFIADFWRTASARPRCAGLSEAQWVSLAVFALAVALVCWK